MVLGPAITVHQAVHGYRSGHELLQASTRLSPEIQRTMLVQSDLSGPALAAGFEEYLTGYPLDPMGTYVLARTWYAPEMDRPGCVWTHSLLIGYAELAQLPSLSALLEAFRRPSRAAYEKDFLPPLTVFAAEDSKELDSQLEGVALLLFDKLYGSPESAVGIFAANAAVYESLVVSLWSQQWPRLRRSFRFCTGALAPRTQDSTVFDLLVAPSALRSRIVRELSSAVVIEEGEPPSTASWAAAGLRDLCGVEPRLRDFLWSYGADVSRPRHAWRPLVRLYEMIFSPADPVSAESVVDLVGSSFPTSDDGKRLKIALFGPTPMLRKELGHLEFRQVLLAIARTPHDQAFSDGELRFCDQARDFWNADRDGSSQLLRDLLTAPLNSVGEAILGALCDAVGPTVAVELEKTQRGILTVLIDRSPAIASSPAVWQVSLDRQREFIDILARKGNDAVRDVVGAMLSAGSSDLAGDVARILGPEVTDAILAAVDADQQMMSREIGREWSEILTAAPGRVLDWLRSSSPSPERLSFAVQHLDPRADPVRGIPPATWLALGAGLEGLPILARTRSAAFLLAIGLASKLADGASLVAVSYIHVFRAAARSELSYGAWRWLGDDLPPRSWYRQWDYCERLSLGIVDRFVRYKWPLQQFFQAVIDPPALHQAIDAARENRSTRELLWDIRGELARGTISVTPAQRRVLDDRL